MTLENIAKAAGVSVGTVSKAFRGSPEISKKTRDAIFKIAKDNGCFDKYYKVPRHRPIIALLAPEPEGEYYGNEIGILERALFLRGADTVIAFTRFSPEKEVRLFRIFAYEMKVDGFVIWSSGELIKNPYKIPLVALTSGKKAPENADVIYVDIEDAIFRLAEKLKSFGHSNVGFICDKITVGKEKLLKRAMRKVGLPVHDKYMITSKERFDKAGIDGMKRLIDSGNIPSVIVTAYDEIAYGAMRYAEDRGYKIPDDISFVGMEELSSTKYIGVSLTSMHAELEKASDVIADIIFRKIENKHYKERSEITIPVTIEMRDSLKNLNEGDE